MYPRQFEYVRANSVDEAIQALQSNEDAKILAGGHSLLPAMKLRLASPAVLVDISKLAELKNVLVDRGSSLRIGAGATYDELLRNGSFNGSYTALSEAMSKVGDVQVRNLGTLGGSVAHADPAADAPAALLALNATLVARGPNGEREISADDFFVDILTTALEPDEVLTEIRVPGGSKSAYEKFAHPASGYAVCGVAAAVTDGGVRVAVTGATFKATRLTAVEQALGSSRDAAAIEQAVAQVGDQDWAGDHFASAEYRAHLTKVLAKRALTRVLGG